MFPSIRRIIMERKIPGFRGYCPIIVVVLSVFAVFTAAGIAVAEKNVQVMPMLGSSAVNAAVSSSSSAAVNSEAEELAGQVRQAIEKLKSSDAADGSYASSNKNTRKSDSSSEFGEYKRFHFRKTAKTPRRIEVTPPVAASRRKAQTADSDKSTARSFLNTMQGIMGIENPDEELSFESRMTDKLGYRHLRFSQKYRNLPVWPAELTVHLNADGDVYLMNGAFVQTPGKIPNEPVIQANKAVELARASMEDGGKADAKTPELIIYAPGDRASRMAWKVTLEISPASQWIVLVDAGNGNILDGISRVYSNNVAGSDIDLNGVTRTLNVWQQNNLYYMVDTTKDMFVSSSGAQDPSSIKGAITVLDARNQPDTSDVEYIPPLMNVTSSDANSGWITDAVSASYCVSEVYDYYNERHGRNSLDGQGRTIYAVVRLGNDYDNAFWNSETKMVYFGDGSPYAGALDVVAHELAHGVTAYTANLVYQYQSGALNEAFSDIFGEAVEARTNGFTDWTMGTNLSSPLRSLSDPSSINIQAGLPYPEKMSDYINTSQDNGGVHLNCTIVEYAFYMLAEGLTEAIGIQDAEKIFYRALVYHLVSNSQFIDARLACIDAAEELFGDGSNQAARVAAAFDAVEIFDDEGTSQETTSVTPIDTDDSIIYVYYDNDRMGYFLGRKTKSDPSSGAGLSDRRVELAKASVTADGTLAAFVSSGNDLCFIEPGGDGGESCLGRNDISSVAMSRDGNKYGFVFLGPFGGPGDSIAIIDLDGDGTKEFDLVAPNIDGVSTNSIIQADAMTFNLDADMIFYDAYNVIELTDGSTIGAWSIYAIDLETEHTMVIVPPVAGLDIGYPAMSQTSDGYITFDTLDSETGNSTIYAANLITGDMQDIGIVYGSYGIPVYNGDDTGIVYSQTDDSVSTGYSLWQQSVGSDYITPVDSPGLIMQNAILGTIYRFDDSGSADGDGTDGDTNGGGGGGGCFISSGAASWLF